MPKSDGNLSLAPGSWLCYILAAFPYIARWLLGYRKGTRKIPYWSCGVEKQQATEANLKEITASAAKHSEAKAKEAKASDAKLMSMSIAMFMAIVAMWGAVTAYRAALAEQETLRFERRLQQGEMLELVHRQELLSKVASRTRYENSVNLHKPLAESEQEEARKLAAVDRQQAALKKLQAQEEGAYVRSLQPYLSYFDVGVPSDADLETPDSQADGELAADAGLRHSMECLGGGGWQRPKHMGKAGGRRQPGTP